MAPKAVLATFVGYGAGVWFSTLALKKRAALERAKGWLSARGRILESTLYREPNRNSTHFRVRYEFHVGGKIEGATPRIAGDWFWNNKQQAAFVERYVAGQEVEVFYNPRDPEENCLDRTDSSGITVMWLIALAGTSLASLLIWLQLH